MGHSSTKITPFGIPISLNSAIDTFNDLVVESSFFYLNGHLLEPIPYSLIEQHRIFVSCLNRNSPRWPT